MRLTEYHCGTAVIKDKTKIQAAMHKLALYEDLEESSGKVYECVSELRTHRDTYMKHSTPWRVINRAINLIVGLNAEVEVLRKSEKKEKESCTTCKHSKIEPFGSPCSSCVRNATNRYEAQEIE